MDWGKLRFFLGEIFTNFTRNAAMQATAIGTVAVTIVLLGAFLFTRETMQSFGRGVLDRIEIAVYLNQSVDDKHAAAVSNKLAADRRVIHAVYVPRAEGLKQVRASLGRDFDTSLLTSNPLPNAFRVSVRSPQDVPNVAAHIAKIPGVAKVDYAAGTVEQLLRVADILGRIGLGMIGLLLFVAAIIIANTIRLTVFARRREIAIMQLVGATNAYIRGPFICEGLLAGLIGSAIAVGVLAVARAEIVPRLAAVLQFVPFHADDAMIAGELLAVGAAVGFIASWISVGRYLRT